MEYSIAELEKYSGIKAHTIRMWEQRYGVLTPQRTNTNIRFYTDDQLRKLLNVAALVRTGMRISQISVLSDSEMSSTLDDKVGLEDNAMYLKEINELIMSALTYDEAVFHKVFADCMMRYGLQTTYVDILSPVLYRTGLMWTKSEMEVCQEHFISNLVRQKLFTAADKLADPKPDSKRWVLFLPETEEHEIGLLYANVLIRQAGDEVVYLGPRVPMPSLVENIGRIAPDYALTFVKHSAHQKWVQGYIDKLDDKLGHLRPIVAGPPYMFESINMGNNVRTMTDPRELIQMITEHRKTYQEHG